MLVAAAVSMFGVLLLVGALFEACVERWLGVDDIEIKVQRRGRRQEGRS